MRLRRKRDRMIQIKTPDEIALMREAGLVTQRALAKMRAAVAPGVTTGELDRIAEDSIRGEGAVPARGRSGSDVSYGGRRSRSTR